jgi:hypothetical protein
VTNENAHNNLMQILAELGVAGLLAFLAVVALALRPSAGPRPLWRTAAVFGLAAFLITALAGHPLLTPMVAFSFWLVVGIAASGAGPLSPGGERWLRRATVTVVLLLVATLPLRANYERRGADLGGVSVGFTRWERDAEGNRYRFAGERSAIFVDANSRFVRIPLRSPDESPRRVRLHLDGRPAAGLIVQPGMWMEARLLLPPEQDGPKFRRVDILVDPPANHDGPNWILVGRPAESR